MHAPRWTLAALTVAFYWDLPEALNNWDAAIDGLLLFDVVVCFFTGESARSARAVRAQCVLLPCPARAQSARVCVLLLCPRITPHTRAVP